jgi:hypothetical protein
MAVATKPSAGQGARRSRRRLVRGGLVGRRTKFKAGVWGAPVKRGSLAIDYRSCVGVGSVSRHAHDHSTGMNLQLLGPVEAMLAGRPISLGVTKQRALLAVLACQANATVALRRLVEAVGGEVAPAMGVPGPSASPPALVARAAARITDAPRSVPRAARAPPGRARLPNRLRPPARPPSAAGPRRGSVLRSPRVGG